MNCNHDCDRFALLQSVHWHDLDATMDAQEILDAANGADSISYSYLNSANYGHKSGGKWVEPVQCSGSDYSNSSIYNKSNHRVLLQTCKDALKELDTCQEPWFLDVTGGYGTFSIVLHCERTPEEIFDLIEQLDKYPILDDDDVAELDDEGEQEAWENWVARDYMRDLEKKFPRADFDEVTDDDLYEHFREHMEEANVYWETEGMDRIITNSDMERLLDHVKTLPKGATGSLEPETGYKMDDDLDGLRRPATSGTMVLPAWVRTPRRTR